MGFVVNEMVNAEKKIKVNRLVAAQGVTFKSCSTCQGSGQVRKVVNTMLGQMVSSSTCPTCSGTGQVIDQRPPGVDSSGLEPAEEVIKINLTAYFRLAKASLRGMTKQRFGLSAVAIGLGTVLPPEASLGMFVGALVFWIMGRRKQAGTPAEPERGCSS